MITAFLLGICGTYSCDAVAICSVDDKPPLNICLQTVNACLQREIAKGEEYDMAYEICSEMVPPWMLGIDGSEG
jgi:hypothetical protein